MDWFSRLWLLLQVSRGARIATASARIQALSTPKALSKDYIPPREPTWQPWENKTDHRAGVFSTFIICSYCILSLSHHLPFPIRSLLIGWALVAFTHGFLISLRFWLWTTFDWNWSTTLFLACRQTRLAPQTGLFYAYSVSRLSLFLDFFLAATFCEKM